MAAEDRLPRDLLSASEVGVLVFARHFRLVRWKEFTLHGHVAEMGAQLFLNFFEGCCVIQIRDFYPKAWQVLEKSFVDFDVLGQLSFCAPEAFTLRSFRILGPGFGRSEPDFVEILQLLSAHLFYVF